MPPALPVGNESSVNSSNPPANGQSFSAEESDGSTLFDLPRACFLLMRELHAADDFTPLYQLAKTTGLEYPQAADAARALVAAGELMLAVLDPFEGPEFVTVPKADEAEGTAAAQAEAAADDVKLAAAAAELGRAAGDLVAAGRRQRRMAAAVQRDAYGQPIDGGANLIAESDVDMVLADAVTIVTAFDAQRERTAGDDVATESTVNRPTRAGRRSAPAAQVEPNSPQGADSVSPAAAASPPAAAVEIPPGRGARRRAPALAS